MIKNLLQQNLSLRGTLLINPMEDIADNRPPVLVFRLAPFNVYSAEEFIAAITQHIPDKCFQMVRYYGWYSNKSRGMRLKRGLVRPGDEPSENDTDVEIIDVSEYEPKRLPSKTWRECIKKIWEVDPLTCPNCGGEMKIISFIADPSVILQILQHFGLWSSVACNDTHFYFSLLQFQS